MSTTSVVAKAHSEAESPLSPTPSLIHATLAPCASRSVLWVVMVLSRPLWCLWLRLVCAEWFGTILGLLDVTGRSRVSCCGGLGMIIE